VILGEGETVGQERRGVTVNAATVTYRSQRRRRSIRTQKPRAEAWHRRPWVFWTTAATVLRS